MPRLSQRSPLHDVRPALTDRTARALARAGWSVDDVQAVRALCRDRADLVLDGVPLELWPDRSAATVLGWLRAGGEPLLEAMADPERSRRQVQGMRCWTRTYGDLGPLAHAAGLTLTEAAHLLAAGRFTRAELGERAADRLPRAVSASWSDALRSRA